MEYLLAIAPTELTNPIISESKRLIKEIYQKETSGVYYRIKTEQHQDNPRRVFIKGKGEILESDYKPHITLISDIELPNDKLPDLIRSLEKELANQKNFVLNPIGIGDYGQDFTFYIEFQQNRTLTTIFKKALLVIRNYIPKEKYERHRKRTYVPHATILYDDIDPKKVKAAEEMLNKDLFNKSIKVNEIELWALETNRQNIIKKFPLT